MLCVSVFLFTVSVAVAVAVAVAIPTKDVQIVESTIREVRAIAPKDLLSEANEYDHEYASDDDGSVGYLKKTEDGGADGYKHFDSFHKKDGDKYGYEKHSSFGKIQKSEDEAGEDDEGKETQNSYQVAEELNEDDGSSEHYTEGDYNEGDGGHYTDGGESYGYFDDGESAKYSAAEGGESEAEDDGEYY